MKLTCDGEFCLVNTTIQKIWRDSTKIISTFEQSGWRIKRFRKPERSDVVKALLKWFKQERNESVSVSCRRENFCSSYIQKQINVPYNVILHGN